MYSANIAAAGQQQSTITETSPFVVGIGNRPADMKAYHAVGIQSKSLFFVDSSSSVSLYDIKAANAHERRSRTYLEVERKESTEESCGGTWKSSASAEKEAHKPRSWTSYRDPALTEYIIDELSNTR
jgi:phosphatidate phosphatase PAH1